MIINAEILAFVQPLRYDLEEDHDHKLNFIKQNVNSVKTKFDETNGQIFVMKDGSTENDAFAEVFDSIHNVCFVVTKGIFEINYSVDKNSSIHLQEIERIKNFIHNNEEVYDYQELDNSFIVKIIAPEYLKNTWINVDQDWISTEMQRSFFGKSTVKAYEIFKVNIRNNNTYNFKFCYLQPNASISLNTETKKIIRPLNLPKHNSYSINNKIYNLTTRAEIEGTIEITNDNYSEDLIVVVGEQC